MPFHVALVVLEQLISSAQDSLSPVPSGFLFSSIIMSETLAFMVLLIVLIIIVDRRR